MSTGLKITAPIAVASRTFSRHALLRERLLDRFSKVKFNDQGLQLSGPALVEFLQGSEGAIIALEKITEEVLAGLPSLRAISKYGVGLDNLDQDAMSRRHVALGWTGGVNARAVSELALTLMMGLLRRTFFSIRSVSAGKWEYPGGSQLSGKTVGIIGCGHIGQDFTRILRSLGCSVLVHDVLDKSSFCEETGARKAELAPLLREADAVSLHVPYDKSTHHLIGHHTLSLMKQEAILINTSRGNVVDESALHEALLAGRIAGAAVDVFATEPPRDHPLLTHPHFFATPHIGGSSTEAVLAMGTAAINNLAQLLGSRS